jgi:hypothetical protein
MTCVVIASLFPAALGAATEFSQIPCFSGKAETSCREFAHRARDGDYRKTAEGVNGFVRASNAGWREGRPGLLASADLTGEQSEIPKKFRFYQKILLRFSLRAHFP